VECTLPLPAETIAGDVAGNAGTCAVARIKRCAVRGNRSRGFLIQTRDAIVEDCIFDHTSANGVNICCDVKYWCEGIATRDVTIRNCKFIGCQFTFPDIGEVINVFADEPNGFGKAGAHKNVVIENNQFLDTKGKVINIASVDGAVIRNNKFSNPGESCIHITNSRNVRVTNNRLASDKTAVKIGPGVDEATIKVSDNKP
jgi:hypothetical protein